MRIDPNRHRLCVAVGKYITSSRGNNERKLNDISDNTAEPSRMAWNMRLDKQLNGYNGMLLPICAWNSKFTLTTPLQFFCTTYQSAIMCHSERCFSLRKVKCFIILWHIVDSGHTYPSWYASRVASSLVLLTPDVVANHLNMKETLDRPFAIFISLDRCACHW